MVGFVTSEARAREDTLYIQDYCRITRKKGELLAVCDEAGRLHAVANVMGITEMDPLENHISELIEGLEAIIENTRDSIVKTSAKPGQRLSSFTDTLQNQETETLSLTIYPIFQSKVQCELYSVVINTEETERTPVSFTTDAEDIPHCIVDARTGLFLEANKTFQNMLSLDGVELMRARCAEIDMQDLLLLATLNADRRCFFHAQARPGTPKGWFLSETIHYGERECLRIWSPKEIVFPESHMVGSELAKAFRTAWHNKPEQVLICDDNELLLDTCSSIMDWADIAYKIAGNGKEALQLLESDNYDCVLLDLNMPKLNGFDTARLIRKSGRSYRNIPIIAMTATPLTRVDLASQLKHFDAILQKPFDIEDIKTSVDEARNNLRIKNGIHETSHTDIIGSPEHRELPLSDYEPTSFMLQFSSRTDILEGLRERILNNLQSHLDFLRTLHPKTDHRQVVAIVQKTQSMAMSTGAWKLAKQAAIFSEELEKTKSDRFQHSKDALATCLEEALCFYNTVQWERFLKKLQVTTITQTH